MCLILFAHDAHPRYLLVLAANRDEFHDRPTAAAGFWPETPSLLAGRDLQRGGTWLGVSRNGRIAALSNYREFPPHRDGARSRGLLPLEFLRGEAPPDDYLATLRQAAGSYCGFNLLFGTPERLCYASNRGASSSTIPSGIHGLSNHLLNTGWPKVTRGKELLARLLEREEHPDPENLFLLLTDRIPPPDDQLPDTGFGRDWERILAPIFITSPGYGTRSSTIILIDREGYVTFKERSFNADAEAAGTLTFRFRIEP